MYKNILIPTFMDDEERLKAAVSNARLLLSDRGKITLLNVIEEVPIYVETYIPSAVFAGNADEVTGLLKEVAKKLGDGIEAKAVLGHAGRTILDEAQKVNADCIIVSSHRPGLTDYFLGSTAGRVVRHATCPVLVLR